MALLGLSLSAAASAAPTAADLARCASIEPPTDRLACYDTLAGRPARSSMPASAVVAAPAAPSGPTAPAAAAADGSRDFGLRLPRRQTAPQGPDAIQAHVTQVIEDGVGHATLVLDNGQTWTVMDTGARLAVGDLVSIRRAALGSFLMMTPSKHSYRVRRT
jgi:hypothetical protein